MILVYHLIYCSLILITVSIVKSCVFMCLSPVTPETRTVVSVNSLPITVVCLGKLLENIIQFLCALIATLTETLFQYLPIETIP